MNTTTTFRICAAILAIISLSSVIAVAVPNDNNNLAHIFDFSKIANSTDKCYSCSYDSQDKNTNHACKDKPKESDLSDCGPSSLPWRCHKSIGTLKGRTQVKRSCFVWIAEPRCYTWKEEMKRNGQRIDLPDEIPDGEICYCTEDECNGASGVQFNVIGVITATLASFLIRF